MRPLCTSQLLEPSTLEALLDGMGQMSSQVKSSRVLTSAPSLPHLDGMEQMDRGGESIQPVSLPV